MDRCDQRAAHPLDAAGLFRVLLAQGRIGSRHLQLSGVWYALEGVGVSLDRPLVPKVAR